MKYDQSKIMNTNLSRENPTEDRCSSQMTRKQNKHTCILTIISIIMHNEK